MSSVSAQGIAGLNINEELNGLQGMNLQNPEEEDQRSSLAMRQLE